MSVMPDPAVIQQKWGEEKSLFTPLFRSPLKTGFTLHDLRTCPFPPLQCGPVWIGYASEKKPWNWIASKTSLAHM